MRFFFIHLILFFLKRQLFSSKIIYVNPSSAISGTGLFTYPYNTLTPAIDDLINQDGSIIIINENWSVLSLSQGFSINASILIESNIYYPYK